MASADLREELNCSICLSIYTNPVILSCGHNFCLGCINSVLDSQKGSGLYSCPECRNSCFARPQLNRNLKLFNLIRILLASQVGQEETGICCSYCIHLPVSAVKSCLHCEASLCDAHLRSHSKSEEHVLTEPTTSWGHRKCSIHKELLKYYCTEEDACICASCSLVGEHRGHQVELLNEASEKKKKKLRDVLQKLTTKREKTEKRVQSLQKHRRGVQEKAAGGTERLTALIRDIRKQLEDLEKRVLSDITRQQEQVLLTISDLIQQLEKEKDELTRKMSHIEELCNMTDPLTVLQESHRDDFCGAEEGDNEVTQRGDKQVPSGGDLDENLMSLTFDRGLADIVTYVKRKLYVQKVSDMLLNVNTAANFITVSDDLKTVSYSRNNLQMEEKTEKCKDSQVLSTRSFSSGCHYWEVQTSESGVWKVGICYSSTKRHGSLSWIRDNSKYWTLYGFNNDLSVLHDSQQIPLPLTVSCQRFCILLDYEAGRLSFYELCDPIRHLHTFTATFTEPLRAVFCVEWGAWVRIRT